MSPPLKSLIEPITQSRTSSPHPGNWRGSDGNSNNRVIAANGQTFPSGSTHLMQFKAKSKTSKFLKGTSLVGCTTLLKRRGTRCSDKPPCDRNGTVSPERSCLLADVPRTVNRSPNTTRSPILSIGNSKRELADARSNTCSIPGKPASRLAMGEIP